MKDFLKNNNLIYKNGEIFLKSLPEPKTIIITIKFNPKPMHTIKTVLTAKERKEIYKTALASFLEIKRKDTDGYPFMCPELTDAYCKLFKTNLDVHERKEVLDQLTEWKQLKPKELEVSEVGFFGQNEIWFPLDKIGYEKRITVLQKCIHLTM